MKLRYVLLISVLFLCGCGGASGTAGSSGAPTVLPTAAPLQPVWSDEFNGSANAPVDPTKWTSNVGGDGWGNGELEYYTEAVDSSSPNFTTKNAHLDGNGNLAISAIAESPSGKTCWYGTCSYTSARLVTLGKFSKQYGRFEARMKVPPGAGLWPAFWMLGISNDWPNSGEIDVMESIGINPATVYGSAHGPGFVGAAISGQATLPTGQLSDAFHVYAVQWQPGQIQYLLDGVPYETIVPSMMPPGGTWEFDRQPFYLILNLAVGGSSSWGGAPNASTPFPAQLLVDYVRVYQ